MPSTHHLGITRDAVNAELHTTAAALATAFRVENPIEGIDLLSVRINGTAQETAAYHLRQMEYNLAVLQLLNNCLLKIAPPAE